MSERSGADDDAGGGEESIKCLLCMGSVSKAELLDHIAGSDLNYTPHKCDACGFECFSVERAIKHTTETRHPVTLQKTPYNKYAEATIMQAYNDSITARGEKKGLKAKVEDLLGGQEDVDTLHGRIIELQRENGQLKVDSERYKKSKAEMCTENEKLTDYLAKAIDERDAATNKLSDTELELRTVMRRLDDEITIATYQREQAEKESKQRSKEIAHLKEHCHQLKIELHDQRLEYAVQLRTKNDEINRLTNEWMNSERRKSSGERKLRFDDDSLTVGNNSSGLNASKDNSAAENSKMEDLDNFFAVIQQNRRMSMKEQSANPEVLFADNPDLVQSPLRATSGSKRGKSPKSPKPNLLRRMSSIFFPQ